MTARGPTRGERWALGAAGLGVFLAVWVVAVAAGWTSPRFLPSPLAVAATFVDLLREPFAGSTLPGHLLSSLGRFGLGFGLAAAVGVPLGLCMGWSRWLDAVVSPVFEGLRFVAPLAWVPFAALWFGTGIGGPVLVIFSGAFPPCLINAYRGAALVERRLVEAAETLGAGGFRVIVDVLVPGALPSIVAGLRVSAGLAWQSLVGAELIVVGSGIGYVMVQGQSNLSPAIVMAAMAAVGLVGVAIDVLLRAAERHVRRRWETGA